MRRSAGAFISVLALSVLAAAALAATRPVHNGFYVPRGKDHSSAAVQLEVIRHGTMLEAKGSGLSCASKPPLGKYSYIAVSISLPHDIRISKPGRFAFSGNVEVTQTPHPFTTHFMLRGQFARGRIKPLKTVAVRGSVSSDHCVAGTPKHYKLVFDS